jgi:hypothetical protein
MRSPITAFTSTPKAQSLLLPAIAAEGVSGPKPRAGDATVTMLRR